MAVNTSGHIPPITSPRDVETIDLNPYDQNGKPPAKKPVQRLSRADVGGKGTGPGFINIGMLLGPNGLDVDGDGDMDEEDEKLAQVLKEMDKDGDGKISIRELANMGQMQQKKDAQIKNLKKMIVLVVLAALAFCGVMLGLMVAANEASKDSKPASSGALKTIDGKPVSTTQTETQLTLVDFPKQPIKALEKITKLTVPTVDGTKMFFLVDGFDWYSPTAMTIYTTRGYEIRVLDGRVEIVDPQGGYVDYDGSRRRRNLAFSNAMMPPASFA